MRDPRVALAALTAIAAGGCGKTERPGGGTVDAGPDAPSAACDASSAPSGEGVTSLSLPALTRTSFEVMAYASEAPSRSSVTVEYPLSWAVGPDYPASLELELAPVVDVNCCCSPLGEALDIREIDEVEGSLTVTAPTASSVLVQVNGEGTSSFEVQTVASVPEGGLDSCSEYYDDTRELPTQFRVLVDARRPRWTLDPLGLCPNTMQSGQPLPIAFMRAVDETGATYSPVNVIQPAVTLEGDGVELYLPEGAEGHLSEVTALGHGTVTVTATDGLATRQMAVLRSEDLDDMSLSFFMPEIVTRSILEVLEGQTYSVLGEAERVVAVVSSVSSQGVTLCSRPLVTDFSLVSLTPEVCAVETPYCNDTDFTFDGEVLPQFARLLSEGTCTLRVDAPAFGQGNGVSKTFSFYVL